MRRGAGGAPTRRRGTAPSCLLAAASSPSHTGRCPARGPSGQPEPSTPPAGRRRRDCLVSARPLSPARPRTAGSGWTSQASLALPKPLATARQAALVRSSSRASASSRGVPLHPAREFRTSASSRAVSSGRHLTGRCGRARRRACGSRIPPRRVQR